MGTNFAGIHYRADADLGISLGESIAISCLQDYAYCLREQAFKGFEFTKFDGTRIRITGETVKVIGQRKHIGRVHFIFLFEFRVEM